MGKGTHHQLVGVLLEAGPFPILRVADGGEWRLDISGRYRQFLGRKVLVSGRQSDFGMLDVEDIKSAAP